MSEPDFTGDDVAPVLREIGWLALAEGDPDLAWALTFLSGRDDLPFGAQFDDEELGKLAAGENIRVGIRTLAERGILELRIEQRGRPSERWSVFVTEA